MILNESKYTTSPLQINTSDSSLSIGKNIRLSIFLWFLQAPKVTRILLGFLTGIVPKLEVAIPISDKSINKEVFEEFIIFLLYNFNMKVL